MIETLFGEFMWHYNYLSGKFEKDMSLIKESKESD